MNRKIIPFLLLASLFFLTSNPPAYFIGRDPTWYPLQLWDLSGNVNIYTHTLIQKIAQAEGTHLEILDSDSINLLSNLRKESYDGALASLTPMPQAEDQYDFSPPFLSIGDVLVVPILSEISSINDLSGKIVGVYLFDRSRSVAESIDDVIIQSYENIPQALEDLTAEKMDALLMPLLPAKAFIDAFYSEILHITTAPLTQEGLRLLTLKGQKTELQKLFARGLTTLQKSGELQKLQKELEDQNKNCFIKNR